MIKIGAKNNAFFTLKAIFAEENKKEEFIKKKNAITFFMSKRSAYIYLGKKQDFKFNELTEAIISIIKNNEFGFNISLKSFLSKTLRLNKIIKSFVEQTYFKNAEIYNQKNRDSDFQVPKGIVLLDVENKDGKVAFEEANIYGEITTWVRSKQMMPPNVLNSVNFAEEIQEKFSEFKNIKCTVYGKAEIAKMKMGLLLSVNRGSTHDARLVVLEYNGNTKSKDKNALIGKGIMYDSGGYSLKPDPYMEGMKFDMSGAAIVAGAMLAIAKIKPRANYIGILPLTDNMLNGDASVPDMVFKSMSGKSIEVTDTDAEGRLVLADAITYALEKGGATNITTIATLTGAIQSALAHFHTGVWATTEEMWSRINHTAANENELIWRMPFHPGFTKKLQESKVADIKNYDTSKIGGGATSAASFLKYFTNKRPFVHLDIAFTADKSGQALAPFVKTLSKLVK